MAAELAFSWHGPGRRHRTGEHHVLLGDWRHVDIQWLAGHV